MTPEHCFEPPAPESTPQSHKLVSSITVTMLGGYDRVRIWSRGGFAGELTVEAGDGERLAAALGLVEHPL